MNRINVFLSGIIVVLFAACTSNKKMENQDPLPSWNEGVVKSEIIDFIQKTTDPENDAFIQKEDRIATFDNDGTLWAEQPAYFQLLFAFNQIQEKVNEHPEWKKKEILKAVIENDTSKIAKFHTKDILEIVMLSHANNTSKEFEEKVSKWLKEKKHPKLNQPFNTLVYKPMLELINYLKKNDFKVFIVSGGGVEFMRVWAEEAYGIPKDQIIGSSIKTKLEFNNNEPVIKRLPEIDFIDDGKGKPVGIHKFIGRKPVFAVGNSDGDLEMLRWTASGTGERFMLYIHHTDDEREWKYDRNSSIGRLDKGLDTAIEKKWSIVDMKKDWKVIFPN